MITDNMSDEDEIFEIKRIKPLVRNLTKKEAIRIRDRLMENHDRENGLLSRKALTQRPGKEETLRNSDAGSSFKSPNPRKKLVCTSGKSDCKQTGNKSMIRDVAPEAKDRSEELCKKMTERQSETCIKRERQTAQISPSKLITDFFPSSKRSRKSSEPSANDATDFKSSPPSHAPDHTRKKLFNSRYILEMNNNSSVNWVSSPLSLSRLNSNDVNSLSNCKKEEEEVNVSDLPATDSKNYNKSKKPEGASEYSCFYGEHLRKVIYYELKKQDLLEKNAAESGKQFSRVFLPEEYMWFENLFLLPDKALWLFARMLSRKISWHRVSSIEYLDIDRNIEEVFKILNVNKFVDFDVGKEDLKIQMQLLQVKEIQFLRKLFNVTVSSDKKKKNCIIEEIINNCTHQKNVTDFFTKSTTSKRLATLELKVRELLGTCVKMNESALSCLNHLLTLFSMFQNSTEKYSWSTLFRMMFEISTSNVTYVNYVVEPTVIFELRDDFESYDSATTLFWQFVFVIEQKNIIDFHLLAAEAEKQFRALLENLEFVRRYLEMPTFLRRYNAGTVYAKILTKYCETFKKEQSAERIVEITTLLIDQNLFLTGKKGIWYHTLATAQDQMKNPEAAAETLVRALMDESINQVDRLNLQLQGCSLLRKKRHGIPESERRTRLSEMCTIQYREPCKIEITAKALEGNVPGRKSVFVIERENSKVYSSVEECAINYYKSNGLAEGVHAEGFIVQSIYYLIFFDLIYGPGPRGAFQCPFQDGPLDLTSRSFYLNRKTAIDQRLAEMRTWTMETVEEVVGKVYAQNYGLRCVIDWREGYDPTLFCDVVRCIGIPAMASICERFAHDLRTTRSGFPDLTLWDPATGNCKFVEVKGPKDVLSPAQRIWLDFLCEINLSCEICNVVNR